MIPMLIDGALKTLPVRLANGIDEHDVLGLQVSMDQTELLQFQQSC
jgi:hypothetical protein